jgi:tRNA pseudouridine38-40 synthase
MRTVRLTVSYDGTNFFGWQIQASERTVQGELEAALLRIHKEECRVIGSGRTDTGVHASGQVASFTTSRDDFPQERYCEALNANLPGDVRVQDARVVPDTFHARFSAVRRTYRYRWSVPGFHSHEQFRFRTRLGRTPSVGALNRLAVPLIGTHDFSTFTLPSEPSSSRVRTIEQLAFYPGPGELVMQISANAFLWRMVRLIAGTLLHAEERGFSAREIAERLAACDHAVAAPPAPSHGLSLVRVEYKDEE